MSKSGEKPGRIGTTGSESLVHNPFAALAGAKVPATEKTAPAAPKENVPRKGEPPLRDKVVVRRETKGRGGKTVTRLTGIPSQRRESLAKQMKSALGCGAVLEGDDILLLGDLVDRAASWLEAHGAQRVVRGN